MTFKDRTGKPKTVKQAWRYRVDWDKKCRSKIQKKVKDLVRQYWEHDLVYEEFPVVGTRMTLDLYNASKKIAIEVQGKQHREMSKFFHNNSRQIFLAQWKRDSDKSDYCISNGIRLVEIYEDEKLTQEYLDSLNL